MSVRDGPAELPDGAVPRSRQFRVRTEDEGFVILVNPARGSWLCASASVVDILALCDGTRSVAQVAGAYGARFASADPGLVLQDVRRILVTAQSHGFITVEGREASG
jgi:hypothetical protein